MCIDLTELLSIHKMYWSDWDSHPMIAGWNIQSAADLAKHLLAERFGARLAQSNDKFTGKNINTVLYVNVIYDVDVFHPAMQSVVRNPCHQSQCSHLCLLNMNYLYTCACLKNLQLAIDKYTCQSTGKEKRILMGVGNKLATLEYQLFGRREEGRLQTLNLKIDRMTFNSIAGDIFIADNLQRAVVQ